MDKVRIERSENGYERLFINGKDLAGNPNGIGAGTVLHYLRWHLGYEIEFEHRLELSDTKIITLDDGGKLWENGKNKDILENNLTNDKENL